MPKLTMSKEAIEGLPTLPEAKYTVRLDGFKPKMSNKKDSYNLNPQMKVINHPEHNDRMIFENLNSKGDWVWKDFCHAFGVPIESDGNGSYQFPGDFRCSVHQEADCPGNDPENWTYAGPLLGQTAKLYCVQADNSRGGIKLAVKYYVCAVSGC